MWNPLSQLRGDDADACACSSTFADDALVVDGDDCPGDGDLADSPACRATVVDALADREADRVVTRSDGVEREYEGDAAALLVAAGRFAERAAFRDADLAARARRDLLRAAVDATGRAGPVADAAAETGLAEGARRIADYDELRPFVGPTVARSRVAARPPDDARLDDRRTLSTGATVRVYARPGDGLRTYHLEPVEHGLDRATWATLSRARDLLADGGVAGGRSAPGRAVRRVAAEDAPVADLAAALRKHTRGFGVLEDCFADPLVSDVFATAPVTETRLRATVDGERMRTNVRLTRDGADALASRFRRTSGRSFSRASPTLDATADVGGTPVRVAGVTDPVSDGVAFAFRAGGDDALRLPALVDNGTLPADAAALLSVAVERAVASSRTALRDAVQRAGRDAAARPVVEPANTSTGRVLNASAPFRDYLRLRIYVAARRGLRTVVTRVGDARASVTLSPTPNASALRRAKRDVTVEPVGAPTESGIRVRVENLSVRVERGGREVAREPRTVTLTVATSALALHRRVARFERRLSRGPLKPGLGRRLTARLYPVVWARGYAQHGGAPIENVLANRHVELVTNGALLGEQRAAFGHSDPAGRSALRRATARVGLTDLLAPIERRGGPWVDYLLERTPRRAPTGLPGVGGGARSPETTTTVAVNGTADRALYDFIGGRSDDELDAALADAYGARARLVASVRPVRQESKPAPDRPGKNWSLANATERTRVSVTTASAESPEAPAGWHLLWDSGRRVVRRHAVVRTWRNGNRTRRTAARWREVVDVALGVAGDHRSGTPAPPRPVASVHEQGGPFGGPNLADVEAAAVSKLVESRGGADRLARRAARRALDTRPVTVQGECPDGLRDRTYRDLASLRDRVRNVSVSVPRGRLAGRANPAAKLAKRLRERRSELLGAPSRYDHAAERARFAARAAYLDRVLARLDERADRSETARRRLGDVVDDATGVSLGRIQRILQARRSVDAPERRQVSAASPGSAVDLDVIGAPPYLTLAAVDHRRVPAVPPGKSVHPMAARNVNVFTVPYGDAADAVVGGIPGGRGESRVDVRTAALTLRAANRTLASASNATLRARRNELRSSLASSLDGVERRVRSRLRRTTPGVPGLDDETVWRGVARGLARWKTTDERAMAVVNGSAARTITAALVAERGGSWSAVERGRVRLATRITLDDARRNVSRPKQESVNGTLSQTRSVVRAELKRVAGTAVDDLSEYAQKRRFDEVISDVPAGLPVAPVPGYWYATVNVWQVDVRGGYERFVVRAPNGTPDVPGGTTYVREAGTVRVDVDGDGQRETVGRTTPVSFRTWTTVAVAVPPNRRGVGDVNGDADERSPGWSVRSDNPFHSRSPLVDHALRRDIGTGRVDARGTAGAVRG